MPELSIYVQIKAGIIKVTRRSPVEHRFWGFVDKNGPIHPVLKTKCWIWTGYTNPDGYGRIWFEGFQYQSNRFSWMLHKGSIPAGLLVLHTCDNASCVNIHHLWLGTDGDNCRDRDQKGRGIIHVGEKVGSAKLTEEKVKDMRKFRKENPHVSFVKIGIKFGVTDKTAECVIKRLTWRHVD